VQPVALSDGHTFTIEGLVSHHAKKLTIAFVRERDMEHETPFVIEFRFEQSVVVRNHRDHSNWGPEDRHGGFPLRRGQPFEVMITVKSSELQVFINKTYYCDFRFRIAKEIARNLYVNGELTIHRIHSPNSFPQNPSSAYPQYHPQLPQNPFAGAMGYAPAPSYPTAVPGYQPAPSYPQPFCSGPIFNPPVPLTTPISGGLYPGKIIFISGVPNSNASRFTINLACGSHESADYGLTFDARFNFGNSYNVVVRTHRQGGAYGAEERHQNYFPFAARANFEIMILVEQQGFKIAVNNQHFTEFAHRIHPVQRLDFLNIVGDVTLTQVRFQ
jgi:hypothetical protein